MKEMIIRIVDNKPDIEVLVNNMFKEEIMEKNISLTAFTRIMNSVNSLETKEISCDYLLPNPNIIGHASDGVYKRYIVNQPMHKRYITYSVAYINQVDNRAYNINFPNSIYSISIQKDRITDIKAFMYLEWRGLETKLYKYAMPNMLTESCICMGQAEKVVIKGNVIEALEQIIYAPYSHEDLNNVKTFRKTTDYFEYLQDHEVEEKHLYDADKRLRDIF